MIMAVAVGLAAFAAGTHVDTGERLVLFVRHLTLDVVYLLLGERDAAGGQPG